MGNLPFTECFANLVRTGDVLIGLHNREAWEEHRLSAAGRMVLAVIEGAGQPLEPGVIAERLIVTSGSVTSLLDTLEKRGLVRRLPHPDDRRKLLVEITTEAESILDRLLPSLHARERLVMEAALSPDEQAQLLGMLARLEAAASARRARPKHADRSPAPNGGRPPRLRRAGSPS